MGRGLKVRLHSSRCLEEAGKVAYKSIEENNVILLSPACDSWINLEFDIRGEDFK
jgi:UDP-N-acetylmuramoylalanine-D-glutamate ligase